jgi:hypothetical protein
MKTLNFLGFLFLCCFGSTALHAQSVDEIVNKHLEVVGGKEAWKKVNSVRMEGHLTVQGTDVNVVITKVHNKGMRQDIAVGGMNGYLIVTPTAGSVYMPFQGQQQAEAMTADDLKEAQDQIDAQGNLVDYKEKGHTIESLGKEDVDGTDCYKLKLTLKGGKTETLYFDTKNYYLIKVIAKVKANGQEMEQASSFSNFQKLPEGIVVPMTITQQFGDVTITKVEINKPVADTVFKTN